jgi:adenylate cyclase
MWTAGEGTKKSGAPRGIETSPEYLNSPVRIVDDTERPYRRRLAGIVQDMPILEDMRLAGGTDYIIFPLPFLDRERSAYLSFATKAPDGFADGEIEALDLAARLVSPYVERRALRRMAIDLLDTYVGHHAGARIFSGQIRRGAVDTIEAAILMSDLRGFTVLSKKRERPHVIETLNAWFDSNVSAIEAHGGEILKFMGDGLLAVFRAEGDVAEACRRAFAATADTAHAIAAVNAGRAGGGEAEIEYAMGLHVGEVAYGNVGGQKRLDFTVLGPAVNYASRLQELAKRLGQPVLISNAFAECVAERLVDAGAHPLRGIGRAEQVYALPAAA